MSTHGRVKKPSRHNGSRPGTHTSRQESASRNALSQLERAQGEREALSPKHTYRCAIIPRLSRGPGFHVS